MEAIYSVYSIFFIVAHFILLVSVSNGDIDYNDILQLSEDAKELQNDDVLKQVHELGCHVREYYQYIEKGYLTSTLDILPCYDNVTVDACWGSCDSHEIPDYNLPYKISHHPVCSYNGKRERTHRLRYCHPDHPDPYVKVFDAIDCYCLPCSSDDTNCEHLLG